jgi:hypothetical protein
MDSTRNTGSGNSSAFHPSRTQADDPGSEEEDCIILEVLDLLPISYTFPTTPVSADPDRQVLEHTVPLAADPGAPPTSRVRKAPAPAAGPSGAPTPKRQKVPSAGPLREKKRKAIPTSSW